MIDVGRYDRTTASYFLPDKLRSDMARNARAKRFSPVLEVEFIAATMVNRIECALSPEVFAKGDELHLRSDDATLRIVHLRHGAACFRTQRLAPKARKLC